MRKTLTLEEERCKALESYDRAVQFFKENKDISSKERCFMLAASISRLNDIDQRIIDGHWESVDSYKKHIN